MFNKGDIWAFPTDTSFGLGVRADDAGGLQALAELKGRKPNQYFSLIVSDSEMLKKYAYLPEDMDMGKWLVEKPRTAILKPKPILPDSKFWPKDKVAFRISTISEFAQEICSTNVPITATSANFTGEPSIFTMEEIQKKFGNKIKIFDKIPVLEKRSASEIWDFTAPSPQQLR